MKKARPNFGGPQMKREQLEQILLDVQKPAQYIGGELNSIMKDKEKVDCRLAFCFPDKYEVGMSHLGMKILYSLYNERENWWCERVFAPDADMEQLMREKNIPLYGLESLDPICDFDFILFTMQYEMSYTAILNMLDLAGVPVRSKDRTALAPMVVAGGPCACNPEPVADFIDIAHLMALDALNRNESCGGHFRLESVTEEGEAKRDDEHYQYVSVWEYKGDNKEPELHKEELVFENIQVAQRSYK